MYQISEYIYNRHWRCPSLFQISDTLLRFGNRSPQSPDLGQILHSWPPIKKLKIRGRWVSCLTPKKNSHRRPSWMYKIYNILRRFETRARQMRLVAKIEQKLRTLWPPVKFRGGVGQLSEQTLPVQPRTKRPMYFLMGRCSAFSKIRGRVSKKAHGYNRSCSEYVGRLISWRCFSTCFVSRVSLIITKQTWGDELTATVTSDGQIKYVTNKCLAYRHPRTVV